MRLKNILENIENDISYDINELNVQEPEIANVVKNLFFSTELFLRKVKRPLNKKQQKVLLLKIKDSIKGLS